MARSTNSTKKAPAGTEAAANPAGGADAIEQQVVAFAEQLGRIVGTVQAKAEGWMDRAALADEVSRIRDSASSLLTQLGASAEAATGQIVSRVRGARPQAAPVATSTSKSGTRGRSGGVVDAPGKKHRKPVPSVPLRASAADAGRLAKMKTVNANRRRGR